METKVCRLPQTLEGFIGKEGHEALKATSSNCGWTAASSKTPEPSPVELGRKFLYERSQILAQQADRMKGHYERTADERPEWQKGDFSDR